MMRRGVARIFLAGAITGSVLLPLGTVLHLTIRDRIDGLAVLFYLTPWPVIAAGSAVLAVFWRWKERRFPAGAFACLALAGLAAWLGSSWFRHDGPARRGELRVVHWNVQRPNSGLPATARWLREQDADIIALAEGHGRRSSTLARWQAEFPDYRAVEFPGEMTCLIRGKILTQESRVFAENSYCALLRLEVRGHPLTLLQVDITPKPLRSRQPAFTNLTALVRPHVGENFILLGDFNTPRESALLAPLRADMTHAFEAAGRGLAETWPMPLPVLALDQIWTSRRLRAVHCAHGNSLRSDHRAVIADFDFAAP